jgi:hypothetical protein
MARRPLNSTDARAEINRPGFTKAALVRISSDGTVEEDSVVPEAKFLLNPTTWVESKSTNWISQNVPGQSDTIKQWVSGGPRTVSFEALVTKDTTSGLSSEANNQLITNVTNTVSSIAANFFNIPIPPLQDLINSSSSSDEYTANRLNIQNYLDYYRSLTMPTYDENGTLVKSPPLLTLLVGSSLSNAATQVDAKLNAQGQVWILKNYTINITKQLPNLTPMEALVNFQLEQYIVQSISSTAYYPSISQSGNSSPTTSRTKFI